MINPFECPYCNRPTKDENSLCDNCWSEYLGTHIGGRMEKPCDCAICLSLGMRFKSLRDKHDKEAEENG